MQETRTYPKKTAGALMVADIPTINEDATVQQTLAVLTREIGTFSSINYVYIVDAMQKLVGVASIKDLLSAPPEKIVRTLSPKTIASVRAHSDQEHVALLSLRRNIKAIPVTDTDGLFLGVVTSDVILRVLHSENIEDILQFAGAGKVEDPLLHVTDTSALSHFYQRLPWLLFGLGGGLLAAYIIGFFEQTLENSLVLALFIPAIVYMADAVGSQTQMIFIRSLAIEQALNISTYIWREVKINLLLAVILASITYIASFAWLQSVELGIVLSLSILFTVLASMIIAILIPWVFQKIGKDPAIASGPVATVIRDVMSIFIYLGIAALFL